MKKLIIKSLELYDFKGQTRTFCPHADATYVFAKNETGKTKLYEAFAWLFTGYTDAISPKNYNLYDATKELTPETPKARVRATIEIDGLEYVVERSAQAKFVRKRGSLEWVKDTSDSYETRLDDIVISSTDFNAWIEANIGNPILLPYMFIGERFANLALDDKKKAREVLESVSGKVVLEEMSGDYTQILHDLKKYSVEQIKEMCKNQLKPLKARYNELESIIATKQREFSAYDKAQVDALNKDITATHLALGAVEEMIMNASKALEPVVAKRKDMQERIDEVTAELSIRQHKHNDKNRDVLEQAAKPIREIEKTNASILADNKRKQRELAFTEQKLQEERATLTMLQTQRDMLIAQRDVILARTFMESTCPTCGQELPQKELRATQERFNKAKQQDLEMVVAQGKDVRSKIENCEARVKELSEIVEKGYAETPLCDASELERAYAEVEASLISFDATEEYKELTAIISELRENLPTLELNQDENVAKKEKLSDDLKGFYIMLGEYSALERIGEEIEALKQELTEVSIAMVVAEGKLDTIKMYEEEKARIIGDRINDKLRDCKIEMFSRQKDGDLKPDCVILDKKGVPYASTNNANRLNSALSLQMLFCNHCDISLPVFIDEASIYDSSHLPTFDAQSIYLYASNDDEMRIEAYNMN